MRLSYFCAYHTRKPFAAWRFTLHVTAQASRRLPAAADFSQSVQQTNTTQLYIQRILRQLCCIVLVWLTHHSTCCIRMRYM